MGKIQHVQVNRIIEGIQRRRIAGPKASPSHSIEEVAKNVTEHRVVHIGVGNSCGVGKQLGFSALGAMIADCRPMT
jgi:hypothetical protein